MNTIDTLRALCHAAGVGGLTDAADTAKALLTPLVDEVWRDTLGSVCGVRRCGKEGAPVLLLEAHLDEIGLIVTGIDDKGFLRFDKCGGVDRRALQAAPVVVWGRSACPGVICTTPPHLAGKDKTLPEIADMAIDVGLSKEEAEAVIAPGDRVSFASNFTALTADRVTGKALDDRAGVAAVLLALEHLQNKPLCMDVLVCFAVQEELGGHGAKAAGFRLHADYAIATDVSFAHTPDARADQCGVLGEGAMLGIAPILDHTFVKRLETLAKTEDIPLQYEVMGGRTGTDADELAVAAGGVRTALLSIPLRYMHTPAEMAVTTDIEAVARLMAAVAEKGADGE